MYRVMTFGLLLLVAVPLFAFAQTATQRTTESNTEAAGATTEEKEQCVNTVFQDKNGGVLETQEDESDADARERFARTGHAGMADSWSIDRVQMNTDGCAEKTIKAGTVNRPGSVTFCKEDGKTCFTCPKDNSICRGALARVDDALAQSNQTGGDSSAKAAIDRLVDSLRRDQSLFNSKIQAGRQISSMSAALQNAFSGTPSIGGVSTQPLTNYAQAIGEAGQILEVHRDDERDQELFRLYDPSQTPTLLRNAASSARCTGFFELGCQIKERVATAMERGADALDTFDRQITEPPRGQQTGFQETNTAVVPNPSSESSAPPAAPTDPVVRGNCGVSGIAGLIMGAESRCGQINWNPLSSVQGPYHFLCSTWRQYAIDTGYSQYAGCAYRNDPQISTLVLNAKMGQFTQRYGAVWNQVGIPEHVGQYSCHVFGVGGCERFLTLYRQNPNASVEVLRSAFGNTAFENNRSIYHNNRYSPTLAGVVQELDHRLTGSSRQPAYAGRRVTNPAINMLSVLGRSGNGFGDRFGPYPSVGNPGLGAMNPFRALVAGVQRLFGGGSEDDREGGQQNPEVREPGDSVLEEDEISVTQDALPQPALTLIITPQEARVGDTVRFIWAAAGVRGETCTLRDAGNNVVGEGPSGSETTVVASTTPAGAHAFRLRCTPMQGSTPEEEVATLQVVE